MKGEAQEAYEDRWNRIEVLKDQIQRFLQQWERVAVELERQEPGIVPTITAVRAK